MNKNCLLDKQIDLEVNSKVEFIGLKGRQWTLIFLKRIDRNIWKVREVDTREIYVAKMGNKKVLMKELLLSRAAEKVCSTVHYYDFLTCEDKFGILMEYCKWKTLRHTLRFRMINEDRKEIALNVVKQLRKLHLGGMIHGDVKPANIMINEYEVFVEEEDIKLIDFGGGAFIQEGEKGNTISPAYASIRLTLDYEQGFKIRSTLIDELESEVYLVWYILRNGSLPWTGQPVDKIVEMKGIQSDELLIVRLLEAASEGREEDFLDLIDELWPSNT